MADETSVQVLRENGKAPESSPLCGCTVLVAMVPVWCFTNINHLEQGSTLKNFARLWGYLTTDGYLYAGLPDDADQRWLLGSC